MTFQAIILAKKDEFKILQQLVRSHGIQHCTANTFDKSRTPPLIHSPSWEALNCPVTQEIPYISWNPKMNPVHALVPYFFKIQLNIILISMLKYSKWTLPFRFSDQIVLTFKISSCLLHALPTPSFLNLITIIIFGEEWKLQNSSLYNFLQLPVASS
jgi:hypothetical protein